MSVLIEDKDGAPYPHCVHCPDQVAPPGTGSNPANWAHVYQDPESGRMWFLNNCQRTTKGRYGDTMATPPSDVDNRSSTDITKER